MWKIIAIADKDQIYRSGAKTKSFILGMQVMVILEYFIEWLE